MPIIMPLENELNSLKSNLQAQESILKKQANTILNLTTELAYYKKENADLYDYSSSIYFTIDKNYIIQSLNFQAARLLGLDRNLLINQLFLNFLSNNSKNSFQNKIQSTCSTKFKQNFEIELLQRGGTKRQAILESSLCRDDLIRLSLIDITNTRQLESKFFKSEKMLHRVNGLLQESPNAIASSDLELNIKVVNQAFIKLFTKIFSIKIQIDMNINVVLADFPDLIAMLNAACQEAILNNSGTLEFENSNINEVYYYYQMVITSHHNKDIEQIELIFHISDLTESKLAERRQHRLQADISIACRSSAMGEMASAFAHEINQPLTAIIAYSRGCLFTIRNKMNLNIACNKSSSPLNKITSKACSERALSYSSSDDNRLHYKIILDKLTKPLEQIAIQAEHAGKIIHNMKDFMRRSEFLIEETDLNMLIKETLSIFNYESLDIQPNIIFDFTDYLPVIMTNKIHIMQIILNLVRNSIEALQSVQEENPELIIKTRIINDQIAVHVIDNGPGIPLELQNIILSTYFTTKPQGTGIGLGVCRSLVEAHHGTLSIQKHTMKGAWFIFTLPICPIMDNAHARN